MLLESSPFAEARSLLSPLHLANGVGSRATFFLAAPKGVGQIARVAALLLFVDFFDDGLSDWYEMIHHCSFDLHFSNN